MTRDSPCAPSQLGPFAEDMTRDLSRVHMGPILEAFVDTGILMQAIGSVMSAGLTIIATDPNPGMAEHASMKPDMARIARQMADPCAFPFRSGTFDIVACLLGIATLTVRSTTPAMLEMRFGMGPVQADMRTLIMSARG